jgi:hypothetical protein
MKIVRVSPSKVRRVNKRPPTKVPSSYAENIRNTPRGYLDNQAAGEMADQSAFLRAFGGVNFRGM